MAQYATHSTSTFLSAQPRSHNSKTPTLNLRKSTASLRSGPPTGTNGVGGGQVSDDPGATPTNGRHHSLAHELAVALMPEPSAGSKLLAEEFGIEFDEGAEGIDDDDEEDGDDDGDDDVDEVDNVIAQIGNGPSGGSSVYGEDEYGSEGGLGLGHDAQYGDHDIGIPSFANELGGGYHSHDNTSFEADSPTTAPDEDPSDLDPMFNNHSFNHFQTRQRTPDKDAMEVLSQNVEFADKFLAQLRTLDHVDPTPGSSSSSSQQQPNMERMAAGIVRRINEIAREREVQVRELFDCEREFRKMGGDVNGLDVLGQLDELEEIEDLSDPHPSSTQPSSLRMEPLGRQLHTLEEEPASPGPQHHHFASGGGYHNDWELDPDRNHLGDAEYDASPATSPIRDSFPPAPTLQGPVTPAKVVAHLAHVRTFTTSLASSLTSISEHAQVTGVATTDAARKIRSLKNKLGDLKTEWESAERSKARIERWEAGLSESDTTTVPSTPSTPSRTSRRIDGRKFVQEHLQAFEQALVEAALKTQAIMAR